MLSTEKQKTQIPVPFANQYYIQIPNNLMPPGHASLQLMET